jgi:hypothetical protein
LFVTLHQYNKLRRQTPFEKTTTMTEENGTKKKDESLPESLTASTESLASTSVEDLEAGTEKQKGRSEDSPTPDKTVDEKTTSDAGSSSRQPSSNSDSDQAGRQQPTLRSASTGAAVTSMPGAFAIDNPLTDDTIRESIVSANQPQETTSQLQEESIAVGIQIIPVVVAEAVVEAPKASRDSKTSSMKRVAVLLVAILAIIVVVLSVILSKRRSTNTTEGIDLELRRSDMIAFLGQLSPPEVFDPTHPDASVDRIAALDWIVEEDGLQLPIPGSSSSSGGGGSGDDGDDGAAQTLLERYALALLYFSTNGDGWELKNNFLSPFDLCTWNSAYTIKLGDSVNVNITLESQGAICNDDGQFTQFRMCA